MNHLNTAGSNKWIRTRFGTPGNVCKGDPPSEPLRWEMMKAKRWQEHDRDRDRWIERGAVLGPPHFVEWPDGKHFNWGGRFEQISPWGPSGEWRSEILEEPA